jgi:hypothetical protein
MDQLFIKLVIVLDLVIDLSQGLLRLKNDFHMLFIWIILTNVAEVISPIQNRPLQSWRVREDKLGL